METETNLFSLQGQTTIITGASSGIGKATALFFSQLGADTILVDKDQAGLEEMAAALKSKVTTHIVNLEDKIEIDRFWKEIDGAAVDVLVNNAGIYPFKDFMKLDEAYLMKVMRINLYSVLWMCQHHIKQRDKKGGRIVNIGTIEAIMPFKRELIQYSLSKVGVITLTRDLAREFGKKNFRVNAILPGGIRTEGTKSKVRHALANFDINLLSDGYNFMQRIPMGRLGKPEEVAQVIAFLASDLSSYINGALLPVDGGFLSS